jgi:hypothetical protein
MAAQLQPHAGPGQRRRRRAQLGRGLAVGGDDFGPLRREEAHGRDARPREPDHHDALAAEVH